MDPPHKLDAEVDRCISEGAKKAAGRSLHEEALWLHEEASMVKDDAWIVDDVELTWEAALAEATLALARARRDAVPITRHPGLLGLSLEAKRSAERAGVSPTAMLASHQGSRPGPDGVARNLFVAKWKKRGEYGGLLRRLLHARSDETVLKAQRRGEEELERRAAQRLAEYQALDGRRENPAEG